MAEYIKKDDVLSGVFRNSPSDVRGGLMNHLNELDSIDVVTCEECAISDLDGYYCCGSSQMPPHTTFPTNWCNYGEAAKSNG